MSKKIYFIFENDIYKQYKKVLDDLMKPLKSSINYVYIFANDDLKFFDSIQKQDTLCLIHFMTASRVDFYRPKFFEKFQEFKGTKIFIILQRGQFIVNWEKIKYCSKYHIENCIELLLWTENDELILNQNDLTNSNKKKFYQIINNQSSIPINSQTVQSQREGQNKNISKDLINDTDHPHLSYKFLKNLCPIN